MSDEPPRPHGDLDDVDLAASMVEAARRAVDAAAVRPDPEPPKPHGDPLADAVPTGKPLTAEQGFPPAAGTSARPALTITEAAKAAGVDRRTIRRRLDAGDLRHAYREDGDDGPWRIPVDDLLAAGLHLHAPTPATPPPSAPDVDARGRVTAPTAPLPAQTGGTAVPAEVALWRERALVAEALAAERERTISGLELALRALGPGPTTPAPSAPVPAPAPPPPPSQPETARPTWLRRFLNRSMAAHDPAGYGHLVDEWSDRARR